MNIDDTLDLLQQVALIDDRVVKTTETEQAAQVTMWAAVLRDIPLQFAGEAVGRHYAESAWPVMPKDIASRWRVHVKDRLNRAVGTFEPTDHPSVSPDDETGDAFVAVLRAQRQAVAREKSEPIGLRELMPAVGSRLGGGRTTELVPANDQFREAKAARYPKRAMPAGPPERAVLCPACGASPNKPCRSQERGRVLHHNTHWSRQELYAAQQATEGGQT
ncbi:zinc finger domain-containing protein [Streptomyces seoulensis]|uniref:zinc finger domain-containing protein n=1 Tax=Streptomyces seoulensis TaxID=73044 RepID=UPI001FCBB9A8|nr:hypothetical protein [Streptomyces seoulensis]BDH04871.1 hypothetical protein HEK131_20980 [Streptomyces seoulensis]